jgi:N-acetylneuraminic acid mutarotase
MNKRNLLFLALFLLVLALVFSSCGGGAGGGGDGSSTGTTGGGGGGTPTVAFQGFDFDLSPGTYWEYGWSYEYNSLVQGSGGTKKQDAGKVRVTLGNPVVIQGISAFPVTATGDLTDVDNHSYAPRWKYLAVNDHRILGSTDGITLQTIFDAKTGQWKGGGFFAQFGSSIDVKGANGSINNDFTSTSAVVASRSEGQDFCDYIGGVYVCSNDQAYTISESEYLKGGIGPLGHDSYAGYSYEGGGFSSSYSYDRKMGLVATSLVAIDGWEPKPIPWTQKTGMPQPRAYHTAVAVGGNIYVMGGSNGTSSNAVNTVYIYNPATDTWTTGASMPAARAQHAAVAISGRIFVVGGSTIVNGTGTNTVWEYNPTTNTWATKLSTPVILAQHAAAEANTGWIVVFQDGNNYAYAYSPYDPTTNYTWWKIDPNIPNYDRDRAACSLNGKYYLLGGYCGSSCFHPYSDTLLELTLGGAGNPDTWTFKQHMLTSRASLVAAVANGKIYAIGGENSQGDLRVVEEYNPATNSWAKKYSMLKLCWATAAAAVNNKIYLIGGIKTGGYLTTVEEYDPQVDN